MAKVKMPLMSLDASGKLDNSLVYFNWKGVKVVRSYAIPSNPQTPDQMAQRQKFSNAVDSWHNLDPVKQEAWNTAAGGLSNPMSGFNYFIQQSIKQGTDNPNIPGGDTVPPGPPQNVSATGGSGQITINWDANSETDLWGYVIYGDTSSGFTPTRDKEVGRTKDTSFVDYVASGTTMYYIVKAIDTSGNLSAASSEVNATAT